MKRDFWNAIWNNKSYRKTAASIFLLAVFLCFSLAGSGGCQRSIGFEGAVNEDGTVIGEGTVSDSEENSGAQGTGGTGQTVIFVDISGCVAKPGVYQLYEGSRMFEVIELAGGMTEEAEPKSVNRAAVLRDEQVIVVLSKEEYAEQQADLEKNSGYVGGKVELNSASAGVLETLPGIGPSTAERIIQYRETSGPFKRIEDLMKVSGIGEKTFNKLKGSICVQ